MAFFPCIWPYLDSLATQSPKTNLYPDARCMEHLLRWKWPHFRGNVGKYSLHGAYGIFLHILLGNQSAKLHEATFCYKQCSTVPTKTSTICPSDHFSSLPIYCQAFHFSLGGLTGHEFIWSNYSDLARPGPLEAKEGKSPSGKSRLVKYLNGPGW